VRLRGAVALGCILFLQLNVLARAEVAHRWIGVPYPAAALALITAGGIGVLLLLGAPGPIGRRRPTALLLTGLALAGAVAPRFAHASPSALMLLFAAGHCAGLLLLDRALVPAGGRRRGWRLAAGLATMLTLSVAWVLTFYYAFTLPALEGRTGEILVVAAALLAAALALTPRPFETAPILRHPLPAAVALAALLALATVLARRPARAVAAAAPDTLRVATFNIHYGYGEDWAWDPERIARTIEESGAGVVAPQEVPAGLLSAYGADLPLWLGRRLGARALFSPSINGLLGESILTTLPVIDSGSEPLPPPGSDRKVLARALLDAHGDTVAVYAVHFGIYEEEQRVQLEAALPSLARGSRAIFMGDLNAPPESHVVRTLRQAGFRDAFEAAGSSGAPTWPASLPADRIDWIWVRGWAVVDAAVSSGAGSDHRLVWAAIAVRR
jgi:endonuclease/exonuclease/phosphatase family metal-dependent hydrolase